MGATPIANMYTNLPLTMLSADVACRQPDRQGVAALDKEDDMCGLGLLCKHNDKATVWGQALLAVHMWTGEEV